jgi:hypothetical protein
MVDTYLSLFVIYHDVVGLDISVHDTLGMTEIQSFEQLEDVVPNVEVGEFGVKGLELGVLRSRVSCTLV